MSAAPAIHAEGLSKRYRIGPTGGPEERPDTLSGALIALARRPLHNLNRLRALSRFREGDGHPAAGGVIWALEDVSFSVDRGEVVGLIGANGAGKSTLLRILARITTPTRGEAILYGRVGSLLGVGTGFHRELTGRENVYLNGSILGMRRAEIEHKLDAIVDFAGVETFLDTPVKHYSSGMQVRLAFAIAAHLEPEILLVDEVLAVGDAAFQRKCLGKMEDVAGEGRTILFVSHNMAAVEQLCSRCLFLEEGRLRADGPTSEVIADYLARSQGDAAISLARRSDRQGSGVLRFTRARLLGPGREEAAPRTGHPLSVALAYAATPAALEQPLVILVQFFNIHGQRLFSCLSRVAAPDMRCAAPEGEIVCHIPRLPLLPGRYNTHIWCKVGEEVADRIGDAFPVDVAGGDFYGTGRLPPAAGGDMVVEHRWEMWAAPE